MSQYQFEQVEVPRGAYISWGPWVGQQVVGKVLDYDPTGGTDFDGHPCPQLQVDLLEPAKSVNKDNQVSDHAAGELVVLNCGLVSLKRAVKAANLAPGDVVKITLSNLAKVDKGTVKEFSIQVARGAARGQDSPFQQTVRAVGTDPQPAFQPPQAAANPFGAPVAQPTPTANPFGAPVAQPTPTANPFG